MPKSATTAWPPREQDVLRLDVAVDDPVLVGVVQRVGDLAGDAERLGERELAARAPAAAGAISPST